MNRSIFASGGLHRIPLTIVGGPKGSGKTTLLRQFLTCSHGRRIAVVLDHPSALTLSASLIARTTDNSLELHNGSSCLALDGDIGAALSTLHLVRGNALPDHVVVEAPESASPVRMSGYQFLPGFRAGGMVIVVSAPEMAELREVGREPDDALAAQLQHAELLVLNHVDQVKVAARPALRRWVLQRTSRARLIESERCCIPVAMILGTSLSHTPVHTIHGEWSSAFSVDADNRRNGGVQPRHEQDYRAWLLTTRSTIDTGSFRFWVSHLPDSILRGDGVLRITGERSHRFRFERYGLRWSLSRGEPWGEHETEPFSWISLVGFGSPGATSTADTRESALLSVDAREARPSRRALKPPRSLEGLS